MLCVLLLGCAGPVDFTPISPHTDCIVLAPDLAKYASDWRREVAERFPGGAHILIAHGSDYGGEWVVFNAGDPAGRVSDFARRLKSIDSKKPWVLITCNPKAATLSVPGVWYARGNVYNPPGAVPDVWHWTVPWTSSIDDFIEGSE